MLRIAALDIGGANIKACGPEDEVASRPFELWREPEKLAAVLEDCLGGLGRLDILAVTMTGELCDCYRTKREGVLSILQSVERSAASAGGPEIRIWSVAPPGAPVRTTGALRGRLAALEEARREPLASAAANWLALAEFAGRFAPRGPALLIDAGSTTTDIVPLVGGEPVPAGTTDAERLLAGELVYTGVLRTPLAAVVRSLPYRAEDCPIAAELFATTRDAYILLGHLPEAPDDRRTADGRPATRLFAAERLARMVCADCESFSAGDASRAASRVFAEQTRGVQRAAEKVLSRLGAPPETIIIAGAGEFLAKKVAAGLDSRIVSLASELGEAASAAATAVALRRLTLEALGV